MKNFRKNEFFIPCNTIDSIVPNSMGTIKIEMIEQVVGMEVHDSSMKVVLHNLNTPYSRYGFTNDSIVTCECALKSSINLILNISNFQNDTYES